MAPDPWELALLHRPVAERASRRYRGLGLEQDDLVQEGLIALRRAALTFDPATGRPFRSYGRLLACDAMRKALDHGGRWVHLHARPARMGRPAARLPRPDPEAGARPEPEPAGLDPAAPEPTATIDDDERERIIAAVDRLPDRLAHVIRHRYLASPPRTQGEIGADLGLSHVRVWQLERQALRALATVLDD